MRRRSAAASALGVAAVVAGVVVGLSAGSGDDGEGSAASQSTATTEIAVRNLVETDTVDGKLGFSDARPVVNRLAGTLTWMPKVGSVVKTNHRLFEVDGDPVYLLDGSYPAYRTLSSGMKGDDVRQLERNLRVLDLDPNEEMRVDGDWDAGTTAAVKRWQQRKGMAQDGTIEKGRIVFQPGDRRIGEIEQTAGTDAASGASSGANAGRTRTASAAVTEPTMMFASTAQTGPPPTTTPAPPPATTTPAPTTTPSPEATEPKAPQTKQEPKTNAPTTKQEPKAKTPSPSAGSGAPPTQSAPSGGGGGGRAAQAAPSAGAAPSSGSGSAAGASQSGEAQTAQDVAATVMTTTSTKQIVSIDLETNAIALAEQDAEVAVELPGGDTVKGTIVRIGKAATREESSQDEDPPTTIKVTVKLRRSTGTGLDQAPVDVSLERSRTKDALSIPVTALLARPGGTFAVEVRDGDTRRVVPVQTGAYTDGFVQIRGDGLRPGMRVTDARV